MNESMTSKGRRWMAVFGGVAVAVVVVVTAGVLLADRARIVGDTPEERIASIIRVADEDRWGAADAIAAAAANDPSSLVRQAALRALIKYVRAKDRPVVEAAAKSDDDGIRSASAAVLGAYADDDAADRLGELVATDPVEQVRLEAVAGLGRCTSAKGLVHLVVAMEKNDRPTVQMHARTEAFKRLRMPARNTRPGDVAMWRNDTELAKALPQTITAFQQAGVELRLHPEYIIPEPGE